MEALSSFPERHIGPRPADIAKMLAEIGAESLDDLISQTVPSGIRTDRPLALGPALSEMAALADLSELAGDNRVFTSMIGLGYYDTVTPPVILRNVLENPAWYTAYTPYQAGDIPRPPRVAPDVSNDGLRSHRSRDSQRLAAR